jgi:cardiolipin synthase
MTTSDAPFHASPASAVREAQRAEIDRRLRRVTGAPLRTGNQLRLLQNGSATYDDWFAAIKQAQHWIHLENYIFRNDTIGTRFAEALAERAAAGVAVRVLVDWFGSMEVPHSFWRSMRHGGVDVRIVNPPRLSVPLKVFLRDHRKVLAVDGTYASAGGICIADQWLARQPDTGLPYRDTAVSVRGPAVADIERAFADVWDQFGVPLPAEERPDLARIAPAGDENVRVIIQEPGKMRILRVLELLTAIVKQRLWIADAYFLTASSLPQGLMSAAQDGIDVRMLLPATNDLPVVGALSRMGYRQLLESGVRIWEYTGLMMHAKTTVADGVWARVGSTNLNITGLVTDWEIDVVAEDPRFGAQMEAMFEADLANAREIRLAGSAQHPKAQPERRLSAAEREARRHTQGRMPERRSVAVATISRVGQVALQESDDPLSKHERAVTGMISVLLLVISLLSARFPRLLAWPLAAVGALLGWAGVVRAVRPKA